MKQLTTKKWVLSGFLIAALGSQYYFSISSQDLSSIEMSSLSEAGTDSLVDVTAIVEAQLRTMGAAIPEAAPASPSETVTVNPAPPAPAAPESPAAPVVEAPRTEAATPAPCNDCVVFTRAEAERIRAVLASVVESRRAAPVTAAPVPVASNEIDCSSETGAEKIRCEREKREQARRDALEAKREQELDARLTRNEEFLTKLEDAVDRCRGDVSCITRRYTSLLRSYQGSRKIDANVARDAYKAHIEPHLRARLAAGEADESVHEIIDELSSSVPAEYRAIKDNMTLAIRQTSEARAAVIRETYRQSQALTQQNPAESLRLMQEAQAQQYALSAEVFGNPQSGQVGYVSILAENLQTNDLTSWAYVQSNLITPVRNLFTNLMPTGSAQATDSNGQPQQGTGGRGVIRGTTPGPALPQQNLSGAPQTLPQVQNQGITFQQPITTPQGTRGSR